MLQLARFAEPEPVRRYASDTPPELERLIKQLLSKDPADRFPNVLVLSRHMEAMRRALSRPAPDDFALSTESLPEAPPPDASYEAVAMDTTRIEPGLAATPSEDREGEAPDDSAGGTRRQSSDRDNAAPPRAAQTGPQSDGMEFDSDEELQLDPPLHPRTARGDQTINLATSVTQQHRPATRFRTVDQDLLEACREQRASRWVVAAQVLALALLIGLLAAGVRYFSRPATADALYAQIDEIADEGKVESLRTVEDQIDEFLKSYPNDPRAAEVAGYREEIELSRLEGRLHRRAQRRLGGQSLAPIEQMYLDAIRKAEANPSETIEDLRAILILYGSESVALAEEDDAQGAEPDGNSAADPKADETEELNRQVQQCLRLIELRLARLTRYTQMEAANQLPVLHRRLAEARALHASHPARARGIYLAILNLCEGKRWAREVIAEAASSLEALDGPRSRGGE
jgi:hypothetical protein